MDKFKVVFPGVHGKSETWHKVYDLLEENEFRISGYGGDKNGAFICCEEGQKSIKDIVGLLNTNATLRQKVAELEERLAVLEDEGEHMAEPEKRTILNEKWHVREPRCTVKVIEDEYNNVVTRVYMGEFDDEIAATPDMARALKIVIDAVTKTVKEFPTGTVFSTIVARLTMDEWEKIDDALKKAGIK